MNKWLDEQIDYLNDEDNNIYDDYDYNKEIYFIGRIVLK